MRHFNFGIVWELSDREHLEPRNTLLAHLVLDIMIIQLANQLAASCGHTEHIWAKPWEFVNEVGVCEQFGVPMELKLALFWQ